MKYGLSDQVREIAERRYIHPAIQAGQNHFSVSVRELMKDLRPIGFPPNNWPQICSAIQAGKFLRANGLEIESVDGPQSKQSSTVVVRYRIINPPGASALPSVKLGSPDAKQETPEEWAHRLTGQLSGLLKDEIKEFGGTEAFIRWVRGYDEEDKGAA